jgi:hypothetical protein
LARRAASHVDRKEDQPMMKLVLLAAVIGLTPAAGRADPTVCIDSASIDHTDAPDDTAILFTMRDHSVYRARVQGGCVGLSMPGGFSYVGESGTHDICGALFNIRLNNNHVICQMGDLEKIKPAKS